MPNAFEEDLLKIVCNVFDAHAVLLFLPDGNDEKCRLAAFYSQEGELALNEGEPQERGLAGCVILNRRPLLAPNIKPGEGSTGYYEPENTQVRCFMGAPLATGGAICVDSKRQHAFTDRDVQLLQMFADQLQRHESERGSHELTGDLPRYFAELAIIQDLRFKYRRWPEFIANYVSALAEATGFDYCAFASADKDSYLIEAESAELAMSGADAPRLPLGNGLIGYVFLNDSPVIVSESDNAPPTVLFGSREEMPAFPTAVCLPVIIDRSTRGVICLAHNSDKILDEGLHSFVRQAVDHLALFLENLYLRTRLQSLMPKAVIHAGRHNPYSPDSASLPHDPEMEL